MFRAGQYPVKPKLPTLMGYEAAGVVEALGSGVQGFQGRRPRVRPADLPARRIRRVRREGHRAGAQPAADAAGSYAGRSRVDLDAVLHGARDHRSGARTVGDYVIIRAASSSVGLAAIQLANWAGATSIAATRHSNKAEALKARARSM